MGDSFGACVAEGKVHAKHRTQEEDLVSCWLAAECHANGEKGRFV